VKRLIAPLPPINSSHPWSTDLIKISPNFKMGIKKILESAGKNHIEPIKYRSPPTAFKKLTPFKVKKCNKKIKIKERDKRMDNLTIVGKKIK